MDLYVTDKRHQALLLVIDEVLQAGAACHVARRVHAESALVMLRPELPEPDIPAVHHLPRQLMGNIALGLPPTLVAHSRPQAQIVVVETYNTSPDRDTLVTVESRSTARSITPQCITLVHGGENSPCRDKIGRIFLLDGEAYTTRKTSVNYTERNDPVSAQTRNYLGKFIKGLCQESKRARFFENFFLEARLLTRKFLRIIK